MRVSNEMSGSANHLFRVSSIAFGVCVASLGMTFVSSCADMGAMGDPEAGDEASSTPPAATNDDGDESDPVIELSKREDLVQLMNERLVNVDEFTKVEKMRLREFQGLLKQTAFAQENVAIPKPSELLFERFVFEDSGQELLGAMEVPIDSQGLPLVMWREKHEERVDAKAGNWILQAPHRFFDTKSGDLAISMFAREDPRNARVLFVNTKHRYAQENGEREKKEKNPSDVCHSSGHSFQRLTRLAVKEFRPSAIVQIHGFNERIYEKDGETRNALAIISSGNKKKASNGTRVLVRKLRKIFGQDVLLFPRDISELGATTNVQGKMIKKLYKDQGAQARENSFVHIELSRELRTRLEQDPAALDLFHDALMSTMEQSSE